MAKGAFNPEISKDLQETVRKNPKIKNVYFSEDGHHYFKKHSIEVHSVNEEGFSKGAKKVDALPGAKLGVVKVTLPNKTVKDKMVNVDYTSVAAELTRDEILKATPTAQTRSEKEKLQILTDAAEIAKGADFENLMKKLNPEKAK